MCAASFGYFAARWGSDRALLVTISLESRKSWFKNGTVVVPWENVLAILKPPISQRRMRSDGMGQFFQIRRVVGAEFDRNEMDSCQMWAQFQEIGKNTNWHGIAIARYLECVDLGKSADVLKNFVHGGG